MSKQYRIYENVMIAIANAIRKKSNLTKKIYPNEMAELISAIPKGITAPDYVITESARVAESINSKKITNSLNCIIMSDMHELGNNDVTDQDVLTRYRAANKEAGQAARLIANDFNIDFFANLGDFAWGSSKTTLTDGVSSITTARQYTAEVEKEYETFLTPGNHDPLTYSIAQNGSYLKDLVLDGLTDHYRYLDLEDKKIRVICLNTADLSDVTPEAGSGAENISAAQLQWFANSLDLSEKVDANEWGIIILAHHPLDWNTIMPAANCLQAYLTGTEYYTVYRESAIYKDFANVNMATVICQFHGHTHNLKVDYIHYYDSTTGTYPATTVQRIAIPNACCARNNEYGENGGTEYNGIEFGEETTYSKTAWTKDSTALNAISIDLDNKIIYADCYGAGYDRVIPYTAIETPITYTNRVLTSINEEGNIYNETGYMTDYRLNSSGGISAAAGAIHSGYIEYNNEVIRIYGTTDNAVGYIGNYFILYDESYTKLIQLDFAAIASWGGKWIKIGSKYMLEIDPDTVTNEAMKNALTNARYLKAGFGYCAANDFVITLDENVGSGEVVIMHSIINNLTNITNSNIRTAIQDGFTYSATLTPADNYEISSVSITMNGIDITSTAYDNGVITIENVSGAIVITAQAIAANSYINQIKVSRESANPMGLVYNNGLGYMADYRLNSSAGVVAAAGAIHSGYIEYNNEVIRIYGTTDATPGYSGNYIVFYDSTGTKLIQYAFNTLVENNCTWENVNDKYLLTIDPSTITNETILNHLSNTKFIRVGFGYCDVNDFVVTLDEAIIGEERTVYAIMWSGYDSLNIHNNTRYIDKTFEYSTRLTPHTGIEITGITVQTMTSQNGEAIYADITEEACGTEELYNIGTVRKITVKNTQSHIYIEVNANTLNTTNAVLTSVDSDGNIYNEVGYLEDAKWLEYPISALHKEFYECQGYSVESGYINCTKKEKIYIPFIAYGEPNIPNNYITFHYESDDSSQAGKQCTFSDLIAAGATFEFNGTQPASDGSNITGIVPSYSLLVDCENISSIYIPDDTYCIKVSVGACVDPTKFIVTLT